MSPGSGREAPSLTRFIVLSALLHLLAFVALRDLVGFAEGWPAGTLSMPLSVTVRPASTHQAAAAGADDMRASSRALPVATTADLEPAPRSPGPVAALPAPPRPRTEARPEVQATRNAGELPTAARPRPAQPVDAPARFTAPPAERVVAPAVPLGHLEASPRIDRPFAPMAKLAPPRELPAPGAAPLTPLEPVPRIDREFAPLVRLGPPKELPEADKTPLRRLDSPPTVEKSLEPLPKPEMPRELAAATPLPTLAAPPAMAASDRVASREPAGSGPLMAARRILDRMTRTLLALLLVTGVAPAAGRSQELPPPFPRANATLLYQNNRIAVWDIVWPQGQPTALHRHIYDQVGTYYARGGRIIRTPDGQARTTVTEIGSLSTTRKGTTHIEEGNTDPPLRAVFIELRKDTDSGQTPPPIGPPVLPHEGAKQVLDDDRVVAWDVNWFGGPDGLRYRAAREAVIVWLGEGTVRIIAPSGAATSLDVRAGTMRHLDRGAAETFEMASRSPRALIFEFK